MVSKLFKTLLYIALGLLGAVLVATAVLFIVPDASREVEKSSSSKTSTNPHEDPLLQFVPSDAVVLTSMQGLSEGIQRTLPSSSVLRQLPLELFKDAHALLSMHYISALEPLLVVDLGRKDRADSNVDNFIRQAVDLDLNFNIQPYGRHGSHFALLLTPSEHVLASALLHLESESSIKDAPDFSAAYVQRISEDYIIINNNQFSRLVSLKPYSSFLPAGKSMTFLREMSRWTVLSHASTKAVLGGEYVTYAVAFSYPEGTNKYYALNLDNSSCASSKLLEKLPCSTSCLVDIPVTEESSALRALHIAEAARVQFQGGRQVLLVRTDERTSKIDLEGITPQAIAKHLGDVLQLQQPSGKAPHQAGNAHQPEVVQRVLGSNLIVLGTREAVREYELSPKGAVAASLVGSGNLRVALQLENQLFYSTQKGHYLTVYRKYN